MYPKYKALFAVMAALLAVLIAVGGVQMIGHQKTDKANAELTATLCAQGDPRSRRDLTGSKVAVYDEDSGYRTDVVDAAYLAATAEEIGYIITIERDWVKTGYYSNGADAYESRVSISLRDVQGKNLASTTLRGSEAPQTRRNGFGDWYGTVPGMGEIREVCERFVRKHVPTP